MKLKKRRLKKSWEKRHLVNLPNFTRKNLEVICIAHVINVKTNVQILIVKY
jgi:hypothetical protein